MKNLKFPEISKEIQQSIFGAWGSGQSDDQTYYGGELDEVIIGPGNGGSSGGDSGGGGFDWGYGSGNDGYQGGGDNYGGSGGGGGSTDLPSESEMEWSINQFFNHYNNGNGEAVSLEEIGFIDDIRESDEYTEMMGRVNAQIEASIISYIQSHGVQTNSIGPVQYNFKNAYDFTGDAFAIGAATINGNAQGSFTVDSVGDITWSANVNIDFHDSFEDPWDLFNNFEGSWDPTGTPFEIVGNWDEGASGTIYNYEAGTTPEYDYRGGGSGYQYGY